ncbi:MAG: putative Type IV pilus pilin [Parcubacteria bacterium C7867-007]|nr:MAG: putative Type IV pilus pilin [Parcubacteria bacterium C7867-007]
MKNTRKGFSLIELVVSVGLFAVVMLLSTGAYLSLISLDRKARATNDLVTNLSFAIDTMERSLRTGSEFTCGGEDVGGSTSDCLSGRESISFVNEQNQTITYKQIETTLQQCTGLVCDSLTDPRITIEDVRFFVRGTGTTGPAATQQPWVTFSIKGTITPDSTNGPITFTIQSTASQRKIDL